jgi:transcriptional regulator with XRE-family HTH domain
MKGVEMHPLKRARLENGLSLQALSARSGLAAQTIKRAEEGVSVSELTAFRLAQELGQDPERFVALLHNLEPVVSEATAEAQKQPA